MQTYEAVSVNTTYDIVTQVKCPQSPIIPEDSAWYYDQLVAAKIQDFKTAQSRKGSQL